jgi:uncharacterized protein YyaL (SSP411 family)
VPNKVVVLQTTGQKSPSINDIASFVKDYRSKDGKATAYVCLNYNCQLPTTEIGSMLKMLGLEQPLESVAES